MTISSLAAEPTHLQARDSLQNHSTGTLISSRGNRLPVVDSLRGGAALWVVLFHLVEQFPQNSWNWLAPLRIGFLGVILFIVISGFCIHLSMLKMEGEPGIWKKFWWRRLHRLYPTYLVAIAFSLLLAVAAGRPETLASWRGIADLFLHLLMLHNLFSFSVGGMNNGAFWSLGLEEQLYLLYPIYFLVRKTISVIVALSLSAIVFLAWYLIAPKLHNIDRYLLDLMALGGEHETSSIFSWWAWPFGLWFTWCLGAHAADIHWRGAASKRKTNELFALVLLASAVALSMARDWAHRNSVALSGTMAFVSGFDRLIFAFGCFALLKAISCRATPQSTKSKRSWCVPPVLHNLGKMSYSLYLTHVPVISLTSRWASANNDGYLVAYRVCIQFALCMLAGIALYYFVERKFLKPKK